MQPHETPAGEAPAGPEPAAAAPRPEIVCEDSERYGEAHLLDVAVELGPDTRIAISLPRDHVPSNGDVLRVPFVVRLGRPGVNLHMERAELERLHSLIARALDAERQ